MAYSEKYYHTYCDRYGDTYRISLQEWDFVGTATQVECGTEQFIIERETSARLLMGGVFPTRATATFISDGAFELQELYSGDDKTYLLVRYKNGALNWQGNVIADGFTQSNWDAERMHLTIKATDNLSSLKSSPFVDAVGENYGNDGVNIRSFLWAIKEGLLKTGFNMNIWSFVDIKPMTEETSTLFTLRPSSNPNPAYLTFIWQGNTNEALYFRSLLNVGTVLKISSPAVQGSFTVNNSAITAPSVGQTHVMVWVDETLPFVPPLNTTVEVIQPMPPGGGLDPLFYTDHDVRVWIRDSDIEGKTYFEARGGAMDTWAVLDAIARQWNVIIQQNNGHWEVKRINADKLPSEEYEWFVYNSEGTLINRQPFGEDVLLPCKPTNQNYRIFGTTLSMDRVLKNVIVNYAYKYKQEGDSLKNLVENPDFVGGHSKWTIFRTVAVTPNIIVAPQTGTTPIIGVNSYVRIRNVINNHFLANRDITSQGNPIRQVLGGDNLSISWWQRINGSSPNEAGAISLFGISVWGVGGNYSQSNAAGEVYNLVLENRGIYRARTVNGLNVWEWVYKTSWRKKGYSEANRRFGAPQTGSHNLKNVWKKVILDIPPIPVSGVLEFEIIGAAPLFTNNNFPVSSRPMGSNLAKAYAESRVNIVYEGVAGGDLDMVDMSTWLSIDLSPLMDLDITGIQINRLINADNEVVPQIDPFMYPEYQAQLTRQYSDTIPEIEVLTGDDYGDFIDDRISGMSWEGEPTSFWDTWDNRYGWSRQGLVTAKSVIELYWKPTRLLQCEIGMEDLHWSSRIQFEELPGLRFVILSGSIGGPESTFKGVLKEVHDEADLPLPPGGDDGGNTVNPNWQATGITRCIKDLDGLNTGQAERVEVDANPASPTYGQERWVETGEDLDTCPIGEPTDILWGEQLTLDVEELRTYPYTKTDDTYTVPFSNNNDNVYLRLLHRASLGTIQSILYENGDESISGWEYEADVVIDGYTYKHIRLTWYVGVFSNLNVNFVIN